MLELNESSMGYLGLSENTIGSKAVEVIKVDLINLIKQAKESTNQVEEISGTHAGDKNFLAMPLMMKKPRDANCHDGYNSL